MPLSYTLSRGRRILRRFVPQKLHAPRKNWPCLLPTTAGAGVAYHREDWLLPSLATPACALIAGDRLSWGRPLDDTFLYNTAHLGNMKNRVEAIVVLSQFAASSRTWRALVDALRDPDGLVCTATSPTSDRCSKPAPRMRARSCPRRTPRYGARCGPGRACPDGAW